MTTLARQLEECRRNLHSAQTKVRRRELQLRLKALVVRQLRAEVRQDRRRGTVQE